MNHWIFGYTQCNRTICYLYLYIIYEMVCVFACLVSFLHAYI